MTCSLRSVFSNELYQAHDVIGSTFEDSTLVDPKDMGAMVRKLKRD